MRIPRSEVAPKSAEPSTEQQPESMEDLVKSHRASVVERDNRERAHLDRQMRALNGDAEIDRLKSLGIR